VVRIFAFLAAWVLFAVPGPALAQSGDAPATIEGAKTVSPEQVKAMLGKAVSVDARRRATYLEGHLPGAQSIVSHYNAEAKTFAPAAFGGDKAAPIVIYGHGSDGWSAVYAVRSAVAAGHTNVHWMRSGWAAWTEQKLPVAR
jgi:3-mercaptopyruvate sulfurtransferase SseA